MTPDDKKKLLKNVAMEAARQAIYGLVDKLMAFGATPHDITAWLAALASDWRPPAARKAREAREQGRKR